MDIMREIPDVRVYIDIEMVWARLRNMTQLNSLVIRNFDFNYISPSIWFPTPFKFPQLSNPKNNTTYKYVYRFKYTTYKYVCRFKYTINYAWVVMRNHWNFKKNWV